MRNKIPNFLWQNLSEENLNKVLHAKTSKFELLILEACLLIKKAYEKYENAYELYEEMNFDNPYPIIDSINFQEMLKLAEVELLEDIVAMSESKISIICKLISNRGEELNKEAIENGWKECDEYGSFYKIESHEGKEYLNCSAMLPNNTIEMDGNEINACQVCISAFVERELGEFLRTMAELFNRKQSEILSMIE